VIERVHSSKVVVDLEDGVSRKCKNVFILAKKMIEEIKHILR
jgi:hypothetical protein